MFWSFMCLLSEIWHDLATYGAWIFIGYVFTRHIMGIYWIGYLVNIGMIWQATMHGWLTVATTLHYSLQYHSSVISYCIHAFSNAYHVAVYLVLNGRCMMWELCFYLMFNLLCFLTTMCSVLK
ncbi:hypothetical protein GLYMA_08G026600v4 [Glycine max]|uniref:Uncharacterized protein n=1 Tax=Glycine max TaxID=3847 RepID=I1KPP2_SOYBN|nr:hypothetical protein GYH30_020042 [Glycine max]KRH41383.1 hypothetical protein GLYMA_08G026600v4 [Glycine max]